MASDGVPGQGDQGLRPQGFHEFIGQKQIIENIDIMVKSSKMRGEAMDHVLFSGPRGWGKPPWP